MNGFAGIEFEHVIFDADLLGMFADQVHFYPAKSGIIERVMIECIGVDFAVQFIVYTR